MALGSTFLEILQRPTIGDVVFELMVFMAPIWIAVVVGVLVGWAWKPKWANLNVDFLDSTAKGGESNNKSRMVLPQFSASMPSLSSLKLPVPTCISWISDFGCEKDNASLSKISSPDYSRTVYEDATPEILRDFFWDDEFRLKWDDMLIHAETLDDCSTTGTMMVHWFPFFCSDREYIIGRRIWASGRTYYCVTKAKPEDVNLFKSLPILSFLIGVVECVPCSSVPRRNKPRRVDLYYSSWCIRPAESKRDGRLTACEVLLFHHEDMGIPWEIAKLGVRQGMWGAVKKIDPGLRSYQKHRASGSPLSHSGFMAQINTKVSPDLLESQENKAVHQK
ncbi:UNVERIFIED_CONTAM: hypothetical protein Scaly_2427700 [Sesamum calycinum]|uniref:START domain-containing protein n=1 Tax=Sesamum calycinum TaxID=2727403 RepID=A0AAW2M2A3_9LAMI